jgi:hypothetical protein
MRKNAGFMIMTLLLLTVPALANAWTLTVKVAGGNATNNVTVLTGGVTKTLMGGSTHLYPSGAVTIASIVTPSAITLDGASVADFSAANALTSGSHTVAVSYPAAVLTGFTITQAEGGQIYAQNLNNTWTNSGVSGLTAGTILPVTIAADANHKIVSYSLNGGAAMSAGCTGAAGQVLPLSAAANGQVVTATYGVVGKVSASLFAPSNGVAGKAITCTVTATSNTDGLQYFLSTDNGATFTGPSATGTFTFTPAEGTYNVVAKVTSANDGQFVTPAVKIAVANAMTDANTGCVSCHSTNTPAIVAAYNAGTHGKSTASCKSCHDSAAGHGSVNAAGVKTFADGLPGALPVQKGDPKLAAAAGYVGSVVCSSCHSDKYASWSQTLHNKPLKQLSETGAGVLVNKSKTIDNTKDDFVNGLNFNNYGTATSNTGLTDNSGAKYDNPFNARKPNAPALSYDAATGKRFITIGAVSYEIFRAHGGNGKWKQRFQTKIGNAYYVLNVQYDEMNGRYEEYNGQNWYGVPTTGGWNLTGANAYTPIFISQATLADDVKTKMMTAYGLGKEGGPSNSSWDNRCTGCHQTGMQLAFLGDDTKGEVVAGYVELNVGCEACHGAGAAHVAKPAAGNILQPQKAFVTASTPDYFKADEVCGQCHNRTEGAGHLGANGTTNLVNLPTESPSRENTEDRTATTFYNTNSSDRLNDFVEKYNPGAYGNVDNSGTLKYDGQNFPKFAASNKHHQTFEEIQQGAHGAAVQSQPGHNKGLSCWSCHDSHAANSSNIKSSINGVATNKDDNTLCLACHAEGGDFGSVLKSELNGADKTNEWTAVNVHLSAKLGHTVAKDKYLQSIANGGTTFGAFGNNTIKVGNCISCHMPLTAKSGIQKVATTGDTSKKVGDVHNHAMKTVKASDISGNTVNGGAVNGKAGAATSVGTGVVTSCSVCHVSPDANPTAGNWW